MGRAGTLTHRTHRLSSALPVPHTRTATVAASSTATSAGLVHTPGPPPTSPAPSLTSCPTVDITFVLTGLLSELPREKGNGAHCLVETKGIPNNSSWRVRAFPWITILLIFWRWFLHEPSAYAADISFPFMVVRWIGRSKYSGKWMWNE